MKEDEARRSKNSLPFPSREGGKAYTSRQLSELQKRIERPPQAMVIRRAKAEKYRQADLCRAKESYCEMQKERKSLQAALTEAQLKA